MRSVRVRARKALVAQVRQADAATLRAWRPVFARMSARLATATSAEADAIVAETMRELAGVALTRQVASIRRGVALGARSAAEQHRELTGTGGPMQAPAGARVTATIDADRRRRIAEAATNGSYTRDRIPLSSRLYRNFEDVGRSASDAVRTSIAAREGVFAGAERFLQQNRENLVVPLPRYTEDLIAAARRSLDTDDRSHLERAIEKHAAQMERLGVGREGVEGLSTLRSTVRQFVADLRRARREDIDRIVARHIEDRAQFHARRIVRTETAEAHRRAFRASADESPYTIGYRWKLSPAHPRADVCDLLANQNLHDLGPGGYPKDQVPETPHPNCIPPGHLIETRSGLVPIERIEHGMFVRSHTGAWRKVLRLSAREWAGELVVSTIGERRLVVTPEHPVLTTSGWKLAHLLNPGDGVFLRRDANHPPTEGREVRVLRDIHPALAGRSMPVAGIDFDGDEFVGERQVDVELPDRELTDRIVALGTKRIANRSLMVGQVAQGLSRGRSSNKALESVPHASNGSMGSLGHLGASLGASSSAGDLLLFGGRAPRDACAAEARIDGAPTDAEMGRHLEHTETFDRVEAHDLLEVDVQSEFDSFGPDSEEASRALGPLLDGQSTVRDGLLLGLRTLGDTARGEPRPDQTFAHLETQRDRVNAEKFVDVHATDGFDIDALRCLRSGHFNLVHVGEVRRESYAGPVFNFAVDVDESYCVNGIVTHNCLCSHEAIVDEHHFRRRVAERTGADAPPTPWVDTNRQTAEDWLRGQPHEFQLELLGPTRTAILRDPEDDRPVIGDRGIPIPVRVVLADVRRPR